MYSTSCFQFICVFLSFPPVCACVRACPRARASSSFTRAHCSCQCGNSVQRRTPAHVSDPCEALFTERAFLELDQKLLDSLQKKNGNWR